MYRLLAPLARPLNWVTQGAITMSHPKMAYDPVAWRRMRHLSQWATQITGISEQKLDSQARDYMRSQQSIPPSATASDSIIIIKARDDNEGEGNDEDEEGQRRRNKQTRMMMMQAETRGSSPPQLARHSHNRRVSSLPCSPPLPHSPSFRRSGLRSTFIVKSR